MTTHSLRLRLALLLSLIQQLFSLFCLRSNENVHRERRTASPNQAL